MSFRRASCWLVVVLLAICSPATAQTPALTLRVGPASEGWPAVVSVGPLLEDASLRNALDSALPLRFHLRVELWRDGLLDRLDDTDEVAFALLQDPVAGGYMVEAPDIRRHVPTIGAAQAALEALLRSELRPSRGGRYYYLAILEVETLSLSDLDELRRWLRGEVAPAIEGRSPPTRPVERGLRRLMIRVIGLPTRRFEARTPTFDTG